mgnify:CR=1 FL=1
MENKVLVIGLKQNNVNDETIAKILELKAAAEKLGWVMNDYDAMDGFMFTTFAISKES